MARITFMLVVIAIVIVALVRTAQSPAATPVKWHKLYTQIERDRDGRSFACTYWYNIPSVKFTMQKRICVLVVKRSKA